MEWMRHPYFLILQNFFNYLDRSIVSQKEALWRSLFQSFQLKKNIKILVRYLFPLISVSHIIAPISLPQRKMRLNLPNKIHPKQIREESPKPSSRSLQQGHRPASTHRNANASQLSRTQPILTQRNSPIRNKPKPQLKNSRSCCRRCRTSGRCRCAPG